MYLGVKKLGGKVPMLIQGTKNKTIFITLSEIGGIWRAFAGFSTIVCAWLLYQSL